MSAVTPFSLEASLGRLAPGVLVVALGLLPACSSTGRNESGFEIKGMDVPKAYAYIPIRR